jgi:KRAB domain-containing zinc finger protein
MVNKTYECAVCDKTFGKKYILQRHLRSHLSKTDDKTLQNFIESELKSITHQKIEEKSHCDECGKDYFNKYNYMRHMNTREKNYKCISCQEGFASETELISHLEKELNATKFELYKYKNPV